VCCLFSAAVVRVVQFEWMGTIVVVISELVLVVAAVIEIIILITIVAVKNGESLLQTLPPSSTSSSLLCLIPSLTPPSSSYSLLFHLSLPRLSACSVLVIIFNPSRPIPSHPFSYPIIFLRVIADMAARQACGEVTVKNVVRAPDPAADNGVGTGSRNGRGGDSSSNSEDRGNGSDGEGSSNPVSRSSINTSTSSGGAFGHLKCRKRKTPSADESLKGVAGTADGGLPGNGEKETEIDGVREKLEEHDVEQASKRVKLESSSAVSGTVLDGTSKEILGQAVAAAAGGKEERLRSCLESAVPESTDIIVTNDFGSEVLKVSFTADMWDRLMVPPVAPDTDTDHDPDSDPSSSSPPDKYSREERAAYGVKYNYLLKDKAGEAAVDAPEWLVPQVSPPHTHKHTFSHGDSLLRTSLIFICLSIY
jgi:hypothetical protein